jgi:hypothetical protein
MQVDWGVIGTVLGGFGAIGTVLSAFVAVRVFWTQRIVLQHAFARMIEMSRRAPGIPTRDDGVVLIVTVYNRLDHAIRATDWGLRPRFGPGFSFPPGLRDRLPIRIDRDDFHSLDLPVEFIQEHCGTSPFRAFVRFSNGKIHQTELIYLYESDNAAPPLKP